MDPIIIAGGGIGGLTAALALHAQRLPIVVAEATAELKPLGVGINILPHAVEVLSELGLADALAAAGVPTAALVFANRHGQTIFRDARGLSGGYSWPQYSIHRGRLQMLLWHAVTARGIPVLTGHRLTDWRVDGPGVVTSWAGQADIRGSLLIGADGIHSRVRRAFVPDEGAPKWNGVMMWRGTSRAPAFLDGRTMVQAGHSQAKFVVYPLEDHGDTRLINWIADIRVRADGAGGTLTAPAREDWSRSGRIEDLLPVFGQWRFEWLDVPGLIRAADQILEWPMVDRDPLPGWAGDRVVLLGDAAHPMYPIGSNGATQAILDAKALAAALAGGITDAALAAYDQSRRPMTTEIVRRNRQEGLDAILDLIEAKAPGGFTTIEDVIDPADIARIVQDYKAAAGHKVG